MPTNKFSSMSVPVIASILLLAVFTAVGVGAVLKSDSNDDLPFRVENATGVNSSNPDFIAMISSVSSINIKTDILKSPLFARLMDLREPLNDEAVGKINPFLPN